TRHTPLSLHDAIPISAELNGPNGLAFSPDEKKLYVVESRAQPNRVIWAWDVGADGFTVSSKTKLVDANGPGALDGFKVDTDGNLDRKSTRLKSSHQII